MREVLLLREKPSDEGTFGYWAIEGTWFYSLELPDRDNQPNISCIPPGEYICTLRYSPRFKRNTYWVQDVPDREYILAHSANFAGDVDLGYQSHLNGCIALGLGRGKLINKFGNKQRAILTSRLALTQFEQLMNGEDFKLTIKEI